MRNNPLPNWLDIFLYPRCPLCGRSAHRELCQDCYHQLSRCRLSHPQTHWQGDLPLLAWGAYRGCLKQALAKLKYDHKPEIACLLGQILADLWLEAHPVAPSLLVVPIPLHQERERQRGYNQSALIASSFCQHTGLPLCERGLRRIRFTQAQFSLSKAKREENLCQAFALGQAFSHKQPATPVLLLDDIYTTGATVHSAKQTLEQAGIKAYGLVVVARAQPDSQAQA